MNAKLTKRFGVIVVLLMLVVCLPVAGVAENEEFSAETLAGIGIPRSIAPMLNETAYNMFYLDYNNDGEITIDELNQNVTMTVTAGDGISINEETGFTVWTDPADGQDYIDSPAFVYEITSQQAEGQMIVATITNTRGSSYEHKLTVALHNLVRKAFKVETSLAGKLLKNSYGNYELTVDEGTTITFTAEYEMLNGEEANLSYEWWVYSYDRGDYTTTEPLSTDSVLVVTEPMDNCEYFCYVVSEDDPNLTDQVWTSVTVTPKHEPVDKPVNELIEYESAAEVGVIRGIGPFITDVANALICDYDGNGEITVDELNANITCSMTVGSNISIVDKALTFSIYEEDGEEWIDWPYFAYRADNMSADGEEIVFVITNTQGDRVEIRWTLNVSPATHEPVNELIEYESAAEVGVIRGIGPFITDVANALICDYDGNGEITVDELNTNITCSMTVGSNISIVDKALTFSIYEEDGEEWIDWPYFAFRADNMSADGEKIVFVITNTQGDRVEIRWTLNVSPATQVMVDTEYQEGLSEEVVTESLKLIGLNNAEKITTEMTIKVMSEATGAGMKISTNNVKVYDVYLTVSTDGGSTWVKADESNWPASGKVTVKLPYPAGTNKNYNFVIAHMFTTDSFGKTPGDIEYPVVRKYDTYLEFDVTGLSPVSIAWSEPAPVTTVPTTGDNATPIVWMLGMLIAGAGCAAMLLKRRQHG